MTDDLIERLRHPVNGMRPTLTDGRAAADALTAAQARIAELEAERDATHERGRLQGLDEVHWNLEERHEVILRDETSQEPDTGEVNASDETFRALEEIERAQKVILALKTKGGE